MMGRRRLVVAVVIAAVATGFRRLRSAYALVPDASGADRRDNCSFVQEVRASLQREIAAGLLPSNARKMVQCPLCHEQISVNAN